MLFTIDEQVPNVQVSDTTGDAKSLEDRSLKNYSLFNLYYSKKERKLLTLVIV